MAGSPGPQAGEQGRDLGVGAVGRRSRRGRRRPRPETLRATSLHRVAGPIGGATTDCASAAGPASLPNRHLRRGQPVRDDTSDSMPRLDRHGRARSPRAARLGPLTTNSKDPRSRWHCPGPTTPRPCPACAPRRTCAPIDAPRPRRPRPRRTAARRSPGARDRRHPPVTALVVMLAGPGSAVRAADGGPAVRGPRRAAGRDLPAARRAAAQPAPSAAADAAPRHTTAPGSSRSRGRRACGVSTSSHPTTRRRR